MRKKPKLYCKDCKHTYNEQTLKALEESKQGIGIKEYSSIEEMFKGLNNDDENE